MPLVVSFLQANKILEFESRFAIAKFYFEEPLITKVKKDSKISDFGKIVRTEAQSFPSTD